MNTKFGFSALLSFVQLGVQLGVALGVAVGLTGCGDSMGNGNNDNSGVNAQSSIRNSAIAVSNASLAQCAGGGKVYSVFFDMNTNGLLDTDETVVSQQVVCNGVDGTNGSNGKSTLFSMIRVLPATSVCAAGSGVQLSSGLDVNSDSVLNASEITQTQVLCDGKDGAPGAAGAAGANGHGVVFKTMAADSSQCAAGGSLILMAIDSNDTGVYSALLPGQQSALVCNGVSAPVTAYTSVEALLPCGPGGDNREVLLRLSGGQVLASFSANAQGDMTRLSLLNDGSFQTTDNAQCNFSLATSDDGKTRSISWQNAVRGTWNLN